MPNKGLTIRVESLDALLSANAELNLTIATLQEALRQRDRVLADLQARLAQYRKICEDADYRILVNRIRDDAQSLAEKLRALDLGALESVVRFRAAVLHPDGHGDVSDPKLLPSVLLLLHTLDEMGLDEGHG